MERLPTDYDVIVIGTGMTGSIIAAALSRIGKAVLHIDQNEFYGEEWASFNLDSLHSWLNYDPNFFSESPALSKFIQPTENFIPVSKHKRCQNIQQHWHCPTSNSNNTKNLEKESDDDDEYKKVESKEDILSSKVNLVSSLVNENSCSESILNYWTRDRIQKQYRKFNLDICPKMLYSRGPLVELLITSNIARYCEFKSITRVLTYRNSQLEVVPCSRADVFATKHVSVVQKRMLVKILSLFADYPSSKEEFKDFENKTLVEYLKYKKIPDQLIHYIVYAIAMGSDATPCVEGVEACQRFLQSLGRYGNTPFIISLYGSGELPQCFCRLCAVFGGVYHLNRVVDGIVLSKENSVTAIISGGQRLNAKQFVFSSTVCPGEFLTPDPYPSFLRGIFLTDRSLIESEKEAITLLQYPPRNNTDSPITVMEIGSSCHVAPEGLFLVHMTSQFKENTDLSHVQQALFQGSDEDDNRPRLLWSLTWEMTRGSDIKTPKCPKNLHIFSGPDPGLDYDVSIKQAQDIFHLLCPEEEFLPRAPDSDEIIMDEPVEIEINPEEATKNNECQENEEKSIEDELVEELIKKSNLQNSANAEDTNSFDGGLKEVVQ